MHMNNCMNCKFSMFRWNIDFLTPNRDIPYKLECHVHGDDHIIRMTSQQVAQVFNRGCASFVPNCERMEIKKEDK
jgi:hypothetical protein